MGGTSWDNDYYANRVSMNASSGKKTFDYDDKVKTGQVKFKANDKLDPGKLKAGVRECRDSAAHPNSKPIYIGLDVTGSMQTVPQMIQKKLPQLMGLLIRKGYLTDPAICMSAIDDINVCKIPFQVGQFESGIEIDDDISNIVMTGNGGGNSIESYDLALYFLARCVKADEFEKRNGKGYAFIICDENLPTKALKSHIQETFNQNVEADITIEDLVKEVQERWNLFCIVPNMTSYYNSDSMRTRWKQLLGENVLLLDNPDNIVEMIASTIGVVEGNTDIDSLVSDLVDVGLSKDDANNLSRGLAKYENVSTKGTGLAKL